MTISMIAAIASLIGAAIGAFLLHLAVEWWDGRHDRKLKAEIEAYNRGYKWASEALTAGELPPHVISGFASGWPGQSDEDDAFDRGADAALTDYYRGR